MEVEHPWNSLFMSFDRRRSVSVQAIVLNGPGSDPAWQSVYPAGGGGAAGGGRLIIILAGASSVFHTSELLQIITNIIVTIGLNLYIHR